MSQFYARYVPPVNGTSVKGKEASPTSEKRKRIESALPQVKKSKKRKLLKELGQERSISNENDVLEDESVARNTSDSGGRGILDKYRVTETARIGSPSVDIRTRKPLTEKSHDKMSSSPKADVKNNQGKKTKRSKLNVSDEEENNDGVERASKRHALLLSKFEKARQQERPVSDEAQQEVSEQPPPELHGLEPIPQPEQVDVVPEKPTYSTLPPWQENPLQVSLDVQGSFESLGVPEAVLENLRKRGLENAFPVQAAVLPLLLDSSHTHDGDLCVSAATGSGKTLAYLVPIIADLQKFSGTKLRAVIVVPTRELVKQVRELCDMCASGTSLKIASAVGSKSLKDEQEALILEESVYSPNDYEAQQSGAIDWSTFSLEKLVHRAHTEDPLHSIGFIIRYRSKIDLLITTPGRLVDHLKSTPGFTLDDVKWLVVDEADRLLNESYQEWIDTVTPALSSCASSEEPDHLLRLMRMTPPRRQVRKVLLSATMTRDISKLNALGLYNPKLVILGSVPSGTATGAAEIESTFTSKDEVPYSEDGIFHLPSSLSESVLAVNDASDKPLYLLQLLSQVLGQTLVSSSTRDSLTSPDTINQTSKDVSKDNSSTTSSSEDSSDSSSSMSSEDDDCAESDSSSPSLTSGENAHPGQNSKAACLPRGVETSSPRALVFTRSTASATRLSRLLSLLSPALSGKISTLTRSTASSATSRRALSAFRSSKLLVLIATDRASRGLDVPELEHVISYDVPNSSLTYVHRVGRTARAGKLGHAWTIVEHREGAWFWREIGGKRQTRRAIGETSLHRQSKIKRVTMIMDDEALKKKYEHALEQLGQEARGK